MRIIPKKIRNVGESDGLEYPYIWRNLTVVWNRHSGRIAHIEFTGNQWSDEANARRKCRALNGLPDQHDPAVNILHDMEP